MQRIIWSFAALLCGTMLWVSSLEAQGNASAYKLGAGDRFEVKVIVWNDDERQFELWPFFAGNYAIQTDGSALIPLVGQIPAEGKTRFELSEDISTALRARAGLIEPPSVTLEIVQFRPFYVAGDVASPGEYEIRPGMTVAQAHALSGGRTIGRENQGSAIAAFRDAGTLRQVLGETARARVRLARLEAERNDASAIQYPDDISHPVGPAALAEIQAAEDAIFESRRTALQLEVSTLDELKKLLANEIETLNEKLSGQMEQTRLARENLADLEKLVERGISRTAPLLNAQRGLFELESKELDLQDGIYRARQRVNEADRDLIALQSRRRSEINRDLQSVQANFENLLIRASTLRRLIAENDASAVAVDSTESVFRYTITREVDGQTQVLGAEPGDQIQPGDVLSIEQVALGE